MHGHIVMNIDACSYRNLHDDCLHDDCLHDDCLLLLLFLNESTRSISISKCNETEKYYVVYNRLSGYISLGLAGNAMPWQCHGRTSTRVEQNMRCYDAHQTGIDL